MTHKSNITPATSPLFCNPLLAKHTVLLISMLYFRMCNILKFTQNSLILLTPYLLIYLQQCFMTTLLRDIAFMRNVFCFNGFNQTAIVLHYSAHIKPRKTISTIKQESLADAKVSARQQCVYEDPYRRNLQQICN